MKLTNSIITLLALIPMGLIAGEIQSIDVVLDSLHYVTPKEGKGEAGDLRFRSLDFYSDEIFLNLYDEGNVFDSTLHIRPDFLGIRGKNHALGIKLDTTLMQSIRDLTLGRSAIGFNEKRINFESETLSMDQEMVDLDLKNFNFDCKKHPNYPGNDLDALKYGCLSNSTFSGLEKDKPVLLDATLKNLGEEAKEATISTKINKIEFKTERILMDAESAHLDMGRELNVEAQKMKLTCLKNGDIANFDPNRLMLDCIDDVSFTVKDITVNAEIENETGVDNMVIKSINPAVIMDKKEVRVKAEKIDVAMDGLELTGRNIHLSCEKSNENISNQDVSALAATCLDTSRLREMNGALADFSMRIKNEALGNIVINTQMRGIDMEKGNFSTEIGYTKVNLNNEIVLGTHQLTLGCDAQLAMPKNVTKARLEDINFDHSISSCMNSIKLPKSGLFLYNVGRDGKYYVDANVFNVSKNRVVADLAGVQLANKSGSTTLFNLKGNCAKQATTEAFDYKSMIGECIQQGSFTIASMVNDENNKKAPTIMQVYQRVESSNGRGVNPISLVSALSPELKNISIDAKNGYVSVRVQTKVLGSFRNALLAGNAHFDSNSEKLILDVKEADLPFGISGIKLSLMIIKTIMADDRVEVDSSNKRITINLKY